jgi:hypothetical protein
MERHVSFRMHNIFRFTYMNIIYQCVVAKLCTDKWNKSNWSFDMKAIPVKWPHCIKKRWNNETIPILVEFTFPGGGRVSDLQHAIDPATSLLMERNLRFTIWFSIFRMRHSQQLAATPEHGAFQTKHFNCPIFLEWETPGLHEQSSPARTLGSWVRIPLEEWMSVCAYSVLLLFCV